MVRLMTIAKTKTRPTVNKRPPRESTKDYKSSASQIERAGKKEQCLVGGAGSAENNATEGPT